MNDAEPMLCQGCNRSLKKIFHKVAEHLWCPSCQKKILTHWACVDCGFRYVGAPMEPRGRCRNCRLGDRWRNKSCARCGDTVLKQGVLLPDGRVTCATCRPHFAIRTCHYCGYKGPHVSRDHIRGIHDPACSKCRYKLGRTRICSGCHFPRAIEGERDGKGYCSRCLPLAGPPIGTCKDCGHTRPMYRGQRCEDCSWANTHRRLLDGLAQSISSPWARNLYYSYHQALIQQVTRGGASIATRRDIVFFARLSETFSSQDELTGVQILRRLGHRLAAKYSRAMSFLSAAGYIHTHQDPDYDFEWQLSSIRDRISAAPKWAHPVLTRFLNHMIRLRDMVLDKRSKRRIPMKAKSVESAIRSAVHFLTFACAEGISSIHELNQDLLDLYLGHRRKQRFVIRAFVRYLNKNERMFGKLRVPKPRREFHLNNRLPESRRLSLIKELSHANGNPTNQRWALVSLFALIYMQPPHRTVVMRVDQIHDGGDTVSVLFERHWIEMDPITQRSIRSWLKIRRENSCFERTGESSWLFPGRHAGNHVLPSSLQPWLRQFGVRTRELLQTSIASWVERGIQNPQLLVEAFGISRVTAVTYCEHLGMLLSSETKHAFDSLAAPA